MTRGCDTDGAEAPGWPRPAVGGPVVALGKLVADQVLVLAAPLVAGGQVPVERTTSAGGAPANLAATLARLGVPVRLAGWAGADPLADGLLAGLAARGVEVRVVRRGRAPVSTVLVHPGGERTLLTDRGDGALTPGDLAAVGADPAGLGGAAVLHLDGYDLLPGRFPDAVRAAADTAHAAGVPVSVDVAAANRVRAHGAGAYRELLRALRPDVVLANAAEARVLDLSPADAPLVVVHAGAGPTRVLGTDGVAEVPVPPLPPGALRDTTGCGDALAAGVLAGWRAGLSVRAAVEQGHAAAAAVARVVGGQPPA